VIIKKIEKTAQAVDPKAVFAVAGSVAEPSLIHAVNLAQLDQVATDASATNGTITPTVGDVTPVTGPSKYLFPNCLIGLLFSSFMLSVLIIGFLLLMKI
jgi:hypothetical protein